MGLNQKNEICSYKKIEAERVNSMDDQTIWASAI